MQLDERKIVPPPEALAVAQGNMVRTPDFEVLVERARKRR